MALDYVTSSAIMGLAIPSINGLMPGTLPCGENADEIIFHCLDVGQPVLEQLAAEEKVLARVLDEAPDDA